MRVRAAQPSDASLILALVERLYSETKFLLYEPGESNQSTEAYATRIEQNLTTKNQAMFVADVDEALVGVVFGIRGAARKNRHSMLLVIGVLRTYWGQKVGFSLLKAIEEWARAQGVHRLELSVHAGNTRAIKLYEGVGFRCEGTKQHSLKIEGQYVDELFMSRILDA